MNTIKHRNLKTMVNMEKHKNKQKFIHYATKCGKAADHDNITPEMPKFIGNGVEHTTQRRMKKRYKKEKE